MTKFLPSILPLLIAAATAAAPFVQGWMAEHPTAMTIAGAVYMVLAHMLPSPVAQTELAK
jgi:hypothetical protein